MRAEAEALKQQLAAARAEVERTSKASEWWAVKGSELKLLVGELVEALETELLCQGLVHWTEPGSGDGRFTTEVKHRTELLARAKGVLS
jgi:hypothetical protein